MVNLTCPNCGSDNVRKISTVFSEGISSSKGSVIGYAGGIGLGVGMTNNTSQTLLSLRTAPPSRKKLKFCEKIGLVFCVIVILFMGVLGPIAIASTQMSHVPAGVPKSIVSQHKASEGLIMMLIIPTAIILYFIVKMILNNKYNRETWPELMEHWHNQYICLKCETVFIPNNSK